MELTAQRKGQIINQMKILSSIERKPNISRAELAEKLGIPAPSMTRHIDALIEFGLIKEYKSQESTGGRPPISLQYNYEHSHNLFLLLEENCIILYNMRLDLKVIKKELFKLDDNMEESYILNSVYKLIENNINQSIDAIYISVPDHIYNDEFFNNTIINQLTKKIQLNLHTPVSIFNAVVCQGWGKLYDKQESLLYIFDRNQSPLAIWLNGLDNNPYETPVTDLSKLIFPDPNGGLINVHNYLRKNPQQNAETFLGIISNAFLTFKLDSIYIHSNNFQLIKDLTFLVEKKQLKNIYFIDDIKQIELAGLNYWAMKHADLAKISQNSIEFDNLFK